MTFSPGWTICSCLAARCSSRASTRSAANGWTAGKAVESAAAVTTGACSNWAYPVHCSRSTSTHGTSTAITRRSPLSTASRAPRGTPLPELENHPFHELLPQMPLLPDAQNLFVASPGPVVSHLRLNILSRWRCGALPRLRQSVRAMGGSRARRRGSRARTTRLLRLGRARERRGRARLLGRAFRRL